MPEGDTIRRAALAIDAVLTGLEIETAEASDPRSPLHRRADRLAGRTLERTEPHGKHLLLHFSGELVVHSHLGMNGVWRTSARGGRPPARPWLMLRNGDRWIAQRGGKLLRLTTRAAAARDPALLSLGPDPLDPDFDTDVAAARLLGADPSRQIGELLLDQSLIAGLGNVLRIEACFATRVSPWRRLADLDPAEARALVEVATDHMHRAIAEGRRPTAIYRRPPRPCPRCGGRVRSRGQGDANRITYWCESCQR